MFLDHCRLDKYRPKTDPKYNDFTFEAHIYFDDAFEQVEGSQERHLNKYAKTHPPADVVKSPARCGGMYIYWCSLIPTQVDPVSSTASISSSSTQDDSEFDSEDEYYSDLYYRQNDGGTLV